jgi:hypothetical protein
MYKFPKDLDLNLLVGAHIPQLRFGIGDVQLIFSCHLHICIQGEIDIFLGEKVIANWMQGSLWSSLDFQKIYNKDVLRAHLVNDRTLEIELEDNLKILIYDNSEHYESLQIWFPDGSEIIV